MKKILGSILLLILTQPVFAQLDNIKSMEDLRADRSNIGTAAKLDSAFFQNLAKAIENRSYNNEDFTTLALALTATTADSGVLVVSSSISITTNTTISGQLSVQVNRNGRFNITSGDTLTFADSVSFDAGDFQVFEGAGEVRGLKFVKPEWFGAKGDGSTDDGASIQKALDSIAKGAFSFGARTYLVGQELNIDEVDSNFAIYGIPNATTLKRPDNDSTDSIININKNNVTISDLTFDVNQVNQTAVLRQKAISVSGGRNVRIRNCTFTGGTRLTNSPEMVNVGDNITEFYFLNNTSINNENDFLILQNVDGFVVSGNIFSGDGTSDTANVFTVRDGCSRGILSNNIIHNGGASGIYIDDPDQSGNAPTIISVVGNIITNTFGDCILVEQGTWVNVFGNIIKGDHPVLNGDTGISLGGEWMSAVGNIIDSKHSVGISLFDNGKAQQSNFYKLAVGNMVNNVGDSAGVSFASIWLDDAQRCVVGLNILGDSNVSGGTSDDSTNSGIQQSGTSANNIIVANGIFATEDNTDYNASDYVIGNVDWDLATADYQNIFQLSDIDPNTFGGHQMAIVYHYDNVAISLTNVQVPFDTSSGTLTFWQAPKAGSILALTVRVVGSRSAGTLTVNVRDEGESAGAGLNVVFDGSSSTFAVTSTQAKDVQAFALHQRIFVEITTDGSWAPTTGDLVITLIVEM